MTALSTEENPETQIQASENMVGFHCARNSLCMLVHNNKHSKGGEKQQLQTSWLINLLKKFSVKHSQSVSAFEINVQNID